MADLVTENIEQHPTRKFRIEKDKMLAVGQDIRAERNAVLIDHFDAVRRTKFVTIFDADRSRMQPRKLAFEPREQVNHLGNQPPKLWSKIIYY